MTDSHTLAVALWRAVAVSLEMRCLLLLRQPCGEPGHKPVLSTAGPPACSLVHVASWVLVQFCCPPLAKDMLLLLSQSSAKWQRPRAESAMERRHPQGPHLNCKGDWARAGCVPASICIGLARSPSSCCSHTQLKSVEAAS